MALTRRDISLTIALCASLTLHALLLRAGADMYIKQFSHISLPGFPRAQVESALLIEPPDDPEHRLGANNATGEATSESPGLTPMQAPKGPQIQPLLGLDPPGFGKGSDEPSESQLQQQSAAAAAASPAVQAVAPSPPQSEPAQPFGVGEAANDFASAQQPQPQQSASPPQMASAPQQPAEASVAEKSAGVPMPQGDSESDPITVAGSAVFAHGSAKVRLGRNHKLTRPRLSLAAQADLLTLPRPVVVLKLRIDETGKVYSATIFRSSGSNNIDEPVKLAAYTWWFEPAKDQNGKPTKDVILFTVGFLN
jgi:TonB family protein